MNDTQQFRSALNGFNRNDVVSFIEKQSAEHDQLCRNYQREIAELQQKIDVLSQELQDIKNQAPIQPLSDNANESIRDDSELEVYRRAEAVERAAKERAESLLQRATQQCNTVNALLTTYLESVSSLRTETEHTLAAIITETSTLQAQLTQTMSDIS